MKTVTSADYTVQMTIKPSQFSTYENDIYKNNATEQRYPISYAFKQFLKAKVN
jgi:hypothetical protein